MKEKLSKVQIPALVLAFGGAFLVSSPRFNSNSLPLLIAFLSTITTGVSYTLLSYFKDKVDGLTVIMHFATFSALFSMLFIFISGNFVVPVGKDLFTLMLVGIFGTVGQILLTYAYRLAPASYVSIYNYVGILFSMLMGYFVLHQEVAMSSILGGGIIVIASLMVYIYDQSKRKERGLKECEHCKMP